MVQIFSFGERLNVLFNLASPRCYIKSVMIFKNRSKDKIPEGKGNSIRNSPWDNKVPHQSHPTQS